VRIFQTLLAFSGNAQPQLAVTRKLLERGHEVRVLAHDAARERVTATGAEFVPFMRAQPDLDITRPETDTLRDWRASTRIGAGVRLMRNGLFAFVGGVSRECAEQLARFPADAVLFDWMLTGAGIAAEAARLPSAALVHCPFPVPVAGAPPLFSGLRPMRGRLGAARDGAFSLAARAALVPGLPGLNRARAKQGLGPLRRWDQQLLAANEIYVVTAPELDFATQGRLPANVHYVGPAFEPYPAEWRSPWGAHNDDPLVVISLSTSYMNQQPLAQRILHAIDGLPVRALLTAGPALDTESLDVPANTRVVDFVPHRSVFPHAALVISHAGWQTINAALSDGVPLLCIPDGRDQPDNAARVLAVGAGVRAKKSAPVPKLRKLILGALADSDLREGAKKAAAALARSDGAEVIVTRLGEMIDRQ